MLGGGGKSSGAINEATSEHTSDKIASTIEYMKTKEYEKSRASDTTDVIPTHRKAKKEEKREDMAIYDPKEAKRRMIFENQNEEEGMVEDEDGDDDLAYLRQTRMAAMKKEQTKMDEWKLKGHGWYREIAQDDFFPTVVREKGGSDHCVVHFYHKDFVACKLADRHLSDLAQSWMMVRFVKVDVEKCPFLVDKLKVTVLPCMVLFKNDVACDRLVGFDELGGDDFTDEMLKERLENGFRISVE